MTRSGARPRATGRRMAKASSVVQRYLADHPVPAGDVILIAHAGTIRAVLAIALDLAPDKALRFVIEPLSLTRLDRLAEGWRVVAVNRC